MCDYKYFNREYYRNTKIWLIINIQMLKVILFFVFLATVISDDPGESDLINSVPGYPAGSQNKVYSNYLFADS
mgnify:CR=1 FL=1